MSIKVAVLGAKGRMGAESVKAISGTSDLEIVAQLDLGDSLDKLVSSGAQVVVDFTHPDSVMGNQAVIDAYLGAHHDLSLEEGR